MMILAGDYSPIWRQPTKMSVAICHLISLQSTSIAMENGPVIDDFSPKNGRCPVRKLFVDQRVHHTIHANGGGSRGSMTAIWPCSFLGSFRRSCEATSMDQVTMRHCHARLGIRWLLGWFIFGLQMN